MNAVLADDLTSDEQHFLTIEVENGGGDYFYLNTKWRGELKIAEHLVTLGLLEHGINNKWRKNGDKKYEFTKKGLRLTKSIIRKRKMEWRI